MDVDVSGISQIKNGVKKGEIIGFALGFILLGVSLYAYHLSIKVNKLSIRKLKDEGYE